MTFGSRLDTFFKITERGSTISTELQAGVLTFLAVSYVLIVVPNILSETGMDWGGVLTATAISAAIATIIMALYANYPIAQAPGLGAVAFFTFTIVATIGYSWQEALTATFVSGLLFLILSVSGVRKRLLDVIPCNLRFSITGAIGCFIAFIGLSGCGLIVSNPSTLVGLGDFGDPQVLLSIVGIVLTTVLYLKKVRGSMLIGIVITAIIGMIFGLVTVPQGIVSMPSMPAVGAFLDGFATIHLDIVFIVVVISFLFVDFFDSAGTIMAVGKRSGVMDEDGHLIGGDRALLSDATGTVIGSIIGVSTVTSFVESSTGVECGGRTGLTALTVGVLFLVALFFSPLFSVITYQCTVSVLLIVGALMLSDIKNVEWDDPAMAITALMTILFMVLTYSITNGIAFGMISYCISMIATGRGKQVSWILYAVSVLFVVYFIMITHFI